MAMDTQLIESWKPSGSEVLEALRLLLGARRTHYVRSTQVSKYQHCHTMAYLMQRSESPLLEDPRTKAEAVVAALFHDAFGAVSPQHHAGMAYWALKPFLTNEDVADALLYHDLLMASHWFPRKYTLESFIHEQWFPMGLLFRDYDIAAFTPIDTRDAYFGVELQAVFGVPA